MKQEPQDKDSQAAAEKALRREAADADDLADEATTVTPTNASGPGGSVDDDLAQQQDLSIVGEANVQTGEGLDEAELGRKKPLDGKPWDGNPEEDYGAD